MGTCEVLLTRIIGFYNPLICTYLKSGYDQEIRQSQTADQPTAPREINTEDRQTQHNQSKAISSLFLSQMTAKLERGSNSSTANNSYNEFPLWTGWWTIAFVTLLAIFTRIVTKFKWNEMSTTKFHVFSRLLKGRLRDYYTFFKLNSAEHEMYPANKG